MMRFSLVASLTVHRGATDTSLPSRDALCLAYSVPIVDRHKPGGRARVWDRQVVLVKLVMTVFDCCFVI